jgi:Flp pilus assembly protein TadD
MGNRRVIFLGVLCAICLAASSGWIYYLHSQWSTPERLILRAAKAVQDDDLGRASVLIRNAIRLDPDNAEARIQIANILNRLSDERRAGDVPAAVEQIAHAAKLKPDDLELQTRLFYGWHRLGRRDAATTTARRLTELKSADLIAWMYVIDDELDQGYLESAGRLIDRLE